MIAIQPIRLLKRHPMYDIHFIYPYPIHSIINSFGLYALTYSLNYLTSSLPPR
jgi:hypothetical protein